MTQNGTLAFIPCRGSNRIIDVDVTGSNSPDWGCQQNNPGGGLN